VDPLLTGSSDKIIRLWDTETGLCKLEMSGHTDSIWAVHYDQGAVITASSDRTVKSIQLNPPTQSCNFRGARMANDRHTICVRGPQCGTSGAVSAWRR
jgi:WD40 repeat protein